MIFSLSSRLEKALQKHFLHKSEILLTAGEKLRRCYREEGKGHVHHPDYHIAYLANRLPATYAVAQYIFQKYSRIFQGFQTVLDVGAGPGVIAQALFDSNLQGDLTCLEQDPGFIDIGKVCAPPLNISWKQENILDYTPGDRTYDLVFSSYMFGEIEPRNLRQALENVWASVGSFLILTLPGTPAGYRRLMEIRDFLIPWGGQVIAPCPHQKQCPFNGTEDWCHFSLRLQRPLFLQRAKKGKLSYEDEKFCYLIVGKNNIISSQVPRVIKMPRKGSGHILFDLCAPDGLKRIILSKKNKPQYLHAKKIRWGDTLDDEYFKDG